MRPIEGVDFVQGDFTHESTKATILAVCRLLAPDIILCDMAPNQSGYHDADQLRSVELVLEALDFAKTTLSSGHSAVFLAKVLRGRHLQGTCRHHRQSG